ncbi:MAG: cytochrome b/b6 domain-containing protein [Hyphomicrobiaceae bacterium]|nr:cytochrome b/b6 domain-containing protein [Hyphomicrobiaceae bacterium]
MTSSAGAPTVLAWDAPTRLFHWALVLAIATSWATYEFSESIGDPVLKWHRWSGHVVLVLIVWRVLWGFVGTSTARFATFIPSPSEVAGYVWQMRAGAAPGYLGHNPLGSLMVLALLGLVAAQAVLGLFTVEHNDLTAGPLYRLISEAQQKLLSAWHGFLFEGVIVWLIAAHIIANVAYGFIRRSPHVSAMLTGRKHAGRFADAPAARVPARPLARAFACLLIAAALVYGTIVALGGRFLQMALW